jgi:low affinity Fe/Cu permease
MLREQSPDRRFESPRNAMNRFFTWVASGIAFFVGQPLAFTIALTVVLVWAVTGPMFGFSDTWQLVINTGTTIVTFLVVFLIQNTQNRDAAAMQAKLDELLRAVVEARAQFIGIEHLTENQIEEIRAALEKEAGSNHGKGKTAHESVETLLKRY